MPLRTRSSGRKDIMASLDNIQKRTGAPVSTSDAYIQAYRNSRNNRNAYSMQNPVTDPSSGLLSSPTDPTEKDDFFRNYRKVTKELGNASRTQDRNNISSETRSIMNRIKLPTYSDALSKEQSDRYNTIHEINPEFAERTFNEESNRWDENNFYYKLRAAQVLQKLPKEQREGILNNFNISMYDAKHELDKAIASQNQKDLETLQTLGTGIKNFVKWADNGINDTIQTLLGNREVTVDKNGNTTTTTYTTEPGSLEEFAERMREAGGKSKLSTKEELLESLRNGSKPNKEETEEYESVTANDSPNGDKNTPVAEEDIVEYTYKPGDTFGQVIKNLGLNTDAGLWGEDGDVEFYTNQLYEQGALDERGNIPIGTTIRLRRRK